MARADVDKIIWALRKAGVKYHVSGSVYMKCNHNWSDIDIVTYQEFGGKHVVTLLEEEVGLYWEPGGSEFEDPWAENWKSSGDPMINIINCLNERTYNIWHSSIKMSKELGLIDKKYRVAWFEEGKKIDEALQREGKRKKTSAVAAGSAPF